MTEKDYRPHLVRPHLVVATLRSDSERVFG